MKKMALSATRYVMLVKEFTRQVEFVGMITGYRAKITANNSINNGPVTREGGRQMLAEPAKSGNFQRYMEYEGRAFNLAAKTLHIRFGAIAKSGAKRLPELVDRGKTCTFSNMIEAYILVRSIQQ